MKRGRRQRASAGSEGRRPLKGLLAAAVAAGPRTADPRLSALGGGGMNGPAAACRRLVGDHKLLPWVMSTVGSHIQKLQIHFSPERTGNAACSESSSTLPSPSMS